MLNPEGFIHTPSSEFGCLLWVHLKQYGGVGRQHHRIETFTVPWVENGEENGVAVKWLYCDEKFPDKMRLEKWSCGSIVNRITTHLTEILLLKGTIDDKQTSERFPPLTYVRFPSHSIWEWNVVGDEEVEMYIKEGDWVKEEN
jgi:hypothetical protein